MHMYRCQMGMLQRWTESEMNEETVRNITRDIEVKNNVTIARAGVGGGGGDSR